MTEKAPGKTRARVVIGGIAAALVLVVLAVVLFVDVDRYRPRLESAASEALGLEVRIRGGMDLGFIPPFVLSFSDVNFLRDGAEVLRAERIRARLAAFPLLFGRVRVHELRFDRPSLAVQRTTEGPIDLERYLYRPLRIARERMPGAFDRIREISAAGGKVAYVSRDHALRMEAEGIDLAMRDIVFQGPFGEDPFRNVSFTGKLAVARATLGEAEATGIDCGLKAKNGNYEVHPVALRAFGGTGEGRAWVYLTESIPLIQAKYLLTGLRLEQLSAGFGRKLGILTGSADLSANLFMKGEHPDDLAATASGDLSWRGHDLASLDFHPDRIPATAGKREQTPFARMAALLLPVPPFTAAARELFVRNGPGTGGGEKGPVSALVSTWSVKNGVFEAKDVAFATESRRVALTGRIDLPGERFDDLTVALVDERGCATAAQTIRGPFRLFRTTDIAALPGKAPSVQETKGMPKESGTPAECEIFYAGSLPPPQ